MEEEQGERANQEPHSEQPQQPYTQREHGKLSSSAVCTEKEIEMKILSFLKEEDEDQIDYESVKRDNDDPSTKDIEEAELKPQTTMASAFNDNINRKGQFVSSNIIFILIALCIAVWIVKNEPIKEWMVNPFETQLNADHSIMRIPPWKHESVKSDNNDDGMNCDALTSKRMERNHSQRYRRYQFETDNDESADQKCIMQSGDYDEQNEGKVAAKMDREKIVIDRDKDEGCNEKDIDSLESQDLMESKIEMNAVDNDGIVENLREEDSLESQDSVESKELECIEKGDDIGAELENEEKLGEEATDDIIADAFKVFSINQEIETKNKEQYVDADPDEYGAEFEEALDNISAVVKVDQQNDSKVDKAIIECIDGEFDTKPMEIYASENEKDDNDLKNGNDIKEAHFVSSNIILILIGLCFVFLVIMPKPPDPIPKLPDQYVKSDNNDENWIECIDDFNTVCVEHAPYYAPPQKQQYYCIDNVDDVEFDAISGDKAAVTDFIAMCIEYLLYDDDLYGVYVPFRYQYFGDSSIGGSPQTNYCLFLSPHHGMQRIDNDIQSNIDSMFQQSFSESSRCADPNAGPACLNTFRIDWNDEEKGYEHVIINVNEAVDINANVTCYRNDEGATSRAQDHEYDTINMDLDDIYSNLLRLIPIPRIQRIIKQFLNGKEQCKSINLDEAVYFLILSLNTNDDTADNSNLFVDNNKKNRNNIDITEPYDGDNEGQNENEFINHHLVIVNDVFKTEPTLCYTTSCSLILNGNECQCVDNEVITNQFERCLALNHCNYYFNILSIYNLAENEGYRECILVLNILKMLFNNCLIDMDAAAQCIDISKYLISILLADCGGIQYPLYVLSALNEWGDSVRNIRFDNYLNDKEQEINDEMQKELQQHRLQCNEIDIAVFYGLNGVEVTLDELTAVSIRIKGELTEEILDSSDNEYNYSVERELSDIVATSFCILHQELTHREKLSLIIYKWREPTNNELVDSVARLVRKLAEDAIDNHYFLLEYPSYPYLMKMRVSDGSNINRNDCFQSVFVNIMDNQLNVILIEIVATLSGSSLSRETHVGLSYILKLLPISFQVREELNLNNGTALMGKMISGLEYKDTKIHTINALAKMQEVVAVISVMEDQARDILSYNLQRIQSSLSKASLNAGYLLVMDSFILFNNVYDAESSTEMECSIILNSYSECIGVNNFQRNTECMQQNIDIEHASYLGWRRNKMAHELVKWAQSQDTDNELLISGTLENKVLALLSKKVVNKGNNAVIGILTHNIIYDQTIKNQFVDDLNDECDTITKLYGNGDITMRMMGESALIKAMNTESRKDVEEKDTLTIPITFCVLAFIIGSWRLVLIPLLTFGASICALISVVLYTAAVNKGRIGPYHPPLFSNYGIQMEDEVVRLHQESMNEKRTEEKERERMNEK